MSLNAPAFESIQNKYLLAELKKFAASAYISENYEFLTAKLSNKDMYVKFIDPKAKLQVNLPGKITTPLAKLAQAKKFNDMTPLLKDARREISLVFTDNVNQRLRNNQDLQLAVAIAAMGVDNASLAAKVKPLLIAYLKKDTAQSQYAAYVGLQKLVAKGKLDPVLKDMDAPPPQPPANPEVVKLVEALKKDLAEGLRYYKAAQDNLNKKGVPTDKELLGRMFESGRMRHDKVHLPYVRALKLDADFKTRYKQVVDDKKDLDEAWAAYRKRLNK